MSTENKENQEAKDEAMEKKSEDQQQAEELTDEDLDNVAGGKKIKYDSGF